jgi:hypothetical protein
MIDVAGVEGGHVGMEARAGLFPPDQQFDPAIAFPRAELHQGVLVARQFVPHFAQPLHAAYGSVKAMAETGLTRRIRVKLSSEEAGSISLTPVVVQEMTLHELLEHILASAGKDEERVRGLLRRGAVVSGASRFRWEGWDEDPASLREQLAAFPDPDPARPFSPAACLHAVLRAPGRRLEIDRAAGAARRLLRRRSFWDVLTALAAAGVPEYRDYSYRHRADCYHLPLTSVQLATLRRAASLLAYSGLRDAIRQIGYDSLELYTGR